MCLSYSRDVLLSLRNTLCTLDRDVRLRIKSVIKFRGCRAGRHRHQRSSAVYTAVTGVPVSHVITDMTIDHRHVAGRLMCVMMALRCGKYSN